ncbi:hypothetical protein KIL84_023370 [Mauremys mutica]|uniref:Uncharacterized protein n=1 Tax=Mauremys mutica TaxID=74926 RepID=A0A9D4ARG3_9SAUR|nr:hypothetical protein KIL84_023370 [Mauremys mutica]
MGALKDCDWVEVLARMSDVFQNGGRIFWKQVAQDQRLAPPSSGDKNALNPSESLDVTFPEGRNSKVSSWDVQ